MLKVLPPPSTAKFCHQSQGITEDGPWLTSMLRLGSFRCRWWWNTWCQCGGQITLLVQRLHTSLFLHPPGVTDGSATTSLPSSGRSSMVLFYLWRGQKQLPSRWTSLAVVPPAGTALPATLVVVGREAVPFGVCVALTWAVSEPIGPGRLDTAPSVP